MKKKFILFVILFVNLQIIINKEGFQLSSGIISAQNYGVELNDVVVTAPPLDRCVYCATNYERGTEDEHSKICPDYPATCPKCGASDLTNSTIQNHVCPPNTDQDQDQDQDQDSNPQPGKGQGKGKGQNPGNGTPINPIPWGDDDKYHKPARGEKDYSNKLPKKHAKQKTPKICVPTLLAQILGIENGWTEDEVINYSYTICDILIDEFDINTFSSDFNGVDVNTIKALMDRLGIFYEDITADDVKTAIDSGLPVFFSGTWDEYNKDLYHVFLVGGYYDNIWGGTNCGDFSVTDPWVTDYRPISPDELNKRDADYTKVTGFSSVITHK